MGRRKIEIKAIKDDRNRSVTFLKRKGGLFKKAHELSVLCSVNVAVIIYGSNKKLYEYSSIDMNEMLTSYSYHSGPHEHKGPADYNNGDDDDDDDETATPPRAASIDSHAHMMVGGYPQPFPPHMRQHTQSASPPIISGPFQPQPGMPRSRTPQPPVPPRPSSRTDMSRIPMMPQTPPIGPPQQPVNGFAYMPQPPIYQGQMPIARPPMSQPPAPGPMQYPFAGNQGSPMPPHHHNSPMPHHHGFANDRRPSLHAPPSSHSPSPPPPQQALGLVQPSHISPPQPTSRSLPPQNMMHQQIPHMDATPTSSDMMAPSASSLDSDHVLPPLPAPAPAPAERPQLRTAIPKKLPQRKGHSIFTPIDDNRSSILSQHWMGLSKDTPEEDEGERSPPRSRLSDGSFAPRKTSPSQLRVSSRPEPISEEPSLSASTARSDSLKIPSGPLSAGVRPQLKVQIPISASEDSGEDAAAAAAAPQLAAPDKADDDGNAPMHNIVLPPPSPSGGAMSASALLSAGATGPPNPFARPPPPSRLGAADSAMNIDTPASALPSRFLNNDLLASPNSNFYQDWSLRTGADGGGAGGSILSPLNYATPLNPAGPSFLRDDVAAPGGVKRKSPEMGAEGYELDMKRIKVE